ncbi:T9SS type A sorting domain-containing protein [Croceimicrobium sp.]|uniref:T9SS type A sorting domain-containing protein n=1 Tax=Croceimicrobium sp. TaxID=2828340 RepID=UPI003BAAEB4A
MLAFKRIAVVLITAAFSFNINAAHILGGEITWECANDSMYIFTLVIYRDCAGPVLPTGSQFIQGPAGTIMCNFVPALSGDITPGNGGPACLSCAAGDYGAIEMGVYRSSPLSLSGTPPSFGWEFSWTNCCRPASENSNISSIYLRSKMYPYTAPGQTIPNDVSICYDNGPAFGEPAATIFCPNTSYSYSSKPFDLDSDSLHIYWALPYTGASSPGNYTAGYHSSAPLPNPSQNAANVGPNLNSQTGVLSGASQSPSSGWYIMGLGIKAYRDSQLIAEVVRDAPAYFLSTAACNASANNTAPTLQVDSVNSYSPFSFQNGIYKVQVPIGDSVELDLLGLETDMNPNMSLQASCYNASGLMLNPLDFTDTNGCGGPSPCARLYSMNSSNSFCSTLGNQARFKWNPNCSHVISNLNGSANQKYTFYISLTDDACPSPGQSSITIEVELYDDTLQSPVLTFVGADSTNTVDLAWSAAQINPQKFWYYLIYGNFNDGNGWQVLDTIQQISTTTISLSNQVIPGQYLVQAYGGACGKSVAESNIVQSSGLGLKPISLNAENWNLFPNPSRQFFELQYEGVSELESGGKLKIYATNGTVLMSRDLARDQPSWRINHSLVPGSYVLEIEFDQAILRKRLVVE